MNKHENDDNGLSKQLEGMEEEINSADHLSEKEKEEFIRVTRLYFRFINDSLKEYSFMQDQATKRIESNLDEVITRLDEAISRFDEAISKLENKVNQKLDDETSKLDEYKAHKEKDINNIIKDIYVKVVKAFKRAKREFRGDIRAIKWAIIVGLTIIAIAIGIIGFISKIEGLKISF